MIKIYDDILSEDFCKAAIDQFSNDANVEDDPQPDYSTRKYLNISLQKSWSKISNQILVSSNAVAEKYFYLSQDLHPNVDEVAVHEWIDDSFIMAHYRKGDDLALHVDGQSCEEPNNGLRLATQLFFLTDCQGGELVFPIQEKSIKPKRGRAVMFPPDHTYPHFVSTCDSDRFIIQTWLTDPLIKTVFREEWE